MTNRASWVTRLIDANPMISKELRSRMRSGRSIAVLTAYVTLLGLFGLLYYWIIYASARYRNPYDQQIGRDLLYGIVSFETLLVIFLAPAFTAGVISGERERQTFDLLMTTLLKPSEIILGKIGSALGFLLLLILAVAPLESMAFLFGGVAPEEILGSLIVLICAALLYGSIGIFWSSLMRSTAASTVLSYATLLLLLAGLPFLWFVAMVIIGINDSAALSNNVAWVYFSGIVLATNPLAAMGMSEAFLRQGKPLFFFFDSNIVNGQVLPVLHPWVAYCLFALVGSLIVLWWSIRHLPLVRSQGAPRRLAPPTAGELGAALVAPPVEAARSVLPPPPAHIVGQPVRPPEPAPAGPPAGEPGPSPPPQGAG
jgi:ABC-type transport system involved in multi-copper enzyme maturation permease subunit